MERSDVRYRFVINMASLTERGCYFLTEGIAEAFEKIPDRTKQPRDL